jgi:hypothetical protein
MGTAAMMLLATGCNRPADTSSTSGPTVPLADQPVPTEGPPVAGPPGSDCDNQTWRGHGGGNRMSSNLAKTVAASAAALTLLATGCNAPPSGNQRPPGVGLAPGTPPAQICGSAAQLNGPAKPPAGAIVVPAGNNGAFDFSRAGVTYWFAPGVHTLGNDEFGQIIPGERSTYIGGPLAVIDGQNRNRFAFTQQARNVRIAYLTIRNFGTGADNNNEGVVNHDAGDGWLIEHNTVINNDGAGVFVGDGNTVRYNCLKNNGQYGFSAYELDGVVNVVIDHNEVVGNNTDNWEARIPGCGCAGGAKFWETQTATVTNNWVHHNHGPGLWADFDNRNFLFQGNYFEANEGEALFYEVSYNATIRYNTFWKNTLVKGKEFAGANDDFPVAAVYISESGGDARVVGPPRIEIYGNLFVDNWSGIAVWENADRFCGNGTFGDCTLVGGATTATCVQPGIASKPLYDDCRWKSQNVLVHDNDFRLNPANIGCSNFYCARQAVLSNYGTWPAFSPYMGTKVQQAITFNQNNRWYNNRYQGPWKFVAFESSRLLDAAAWRAAPYKQDAGSTFR